MTTKLDHIAVIVSKLDDAIRFYSEVVGLGTPIIKEIPELGLRCAFFADRDPPWIELVEFSGKGELVHGDVVVAIEVEDLDETLAEYQAKGVRAFDQPATANLPLRRGWIIKKDGHGTVIELCQRGAVARFVKDERSAQG